MSPPLRPERWRRVYRQLLRALPPKVRGDFGAGMEDLLAHRLREARGSRLATLTVWARATVDVAVQAIAMRTERLGKGGAGMSTVAQDLRYGIRSLLKTPGFTLLAVLTLGLGVGASTATFSVVHAVLLRQLPFAEPDRLVFVWPEVNANKAMALRAAERMPALESVSGLSAWTLTLTGLGEPRELTGLLVQPGYFELLGVQPALGRTFVAGEDLPGGGGVVVLSHGLWVEAFGADPGVLGRSIDLGGAEHERREIIGVMPPGVEEFWERVDLWVPLEGDPSLALSADESWYVNARVARLSPGATLEEANEQVAVYAAEVQSELPRNFSEEDVVAATVLPVRQYLTRNVRSAIWVALAAVGLVLLIGCFNVANLLLARGDGRARDLAVRTALGAGRLRLTQMLLFEAVLICFGGGLLGVLSASGLVSVIVRLAPEDFPGIASVAVNGPVLAFGFGAAIATVLGAGLAPAIRVSRTDATAAVGGSARGRAGLSGRRITPLLVGGQVALASIVMVGSGLMLRSLSTLLAQEIGLQGAGVLAFRPNPPAGRYPDAAAFRSYYDEVEARLASLPGVHSVGGIQLLPGTSSNWSFPTFPDGYTIPEGAPVPSVNFRAVRGAYVETTGMRLLVGRSLSNADRADTEPVALVNEAFVSEYWPEGDALGRSLSIFSPSGTSYRVVGVVADIRQHGQAIEPLPEAYFSHGQVPWDQLSMWMLARIEGADPLTLAGAVRDAVWSVDPDVPITGMARFDEVLGRSTRSARFLTLLLTAFGLFSLLLSGVGVFGVTTYLSGRRRPEFGVRMVLGSSRADVVRSAVAGSLGPVVLGLVGGLVLATWASRLLESVLYQVRPTDLPTFVGVAMTLGLVSFLATVIPAWRASRVDPATVLNAG